ncbi:AAA family ATPase [Nostoc sp. 'Peltigera membranacea cyanobiont' N6]|uniref:AAA family ATPase n=1 Tax=Nostoc sp. 'Peltigera membranacea cyanobiont' N6 TaxID=1261031 RepID=UPI000D0BEDA7|nr:AAA family ATPase [Nostoc sp. 'Peltigera membranacea cyanobiont' N6]AVH62115.1 multi-sensor signal transduction multi-kinase [Nostoc sp. 'Peltigera membranacea cyanobiont' N6]
MVSTLVNIPGYRISEELYNGSRTLVYRGYRETDSIPVVIKLLKNPYPSLGELLQFRNQYTIAKNLNSPLIVQTYSLEPYQNAYALVMEDFGGISLKDYFTSDRRPYIASLEEFLRIAIALCNTLDILYHQRIIHKDIKPANILINPKTKQVKLIDFSIASLLPRETQTLINPNVLEGTLAYISPEQTGRMNRGIDYRTDFYSLGVTFYELLTGELPFQSNAPMELVHSHIAKLPPCLREVKSQKSKVKNEETPQVLSEIVSKLMAKNAEDRYQSALGLKFDLEKCLHQLQVDGMIKDFEIGQRDVCDRFIIPDKLYGRETEVQTLLDAFERVSLGATEMMLVAGFSGIGKTAVINEVHKPIVRQRGYFIKGKYDQFQRNIPFSAFVQAFRDLMRQLLSESDAQIQEWRNQILEAVGENGQVIIEVIPELEIIIGEQPPAIELSGTSAQNRFNLLFQKFTQVFTSAEHPLVMFLDDLQWADSASLKLMQLLMADTSHLFLIGAYRDNEVNPAHPLMLTLSEIKKSQATINTITLVPLSNEQVNQLVADTLKCPETLASPLSQLVSQKTQGNPFFATQFLKALHQENIIQFDFESGCWQCDIVQVTTLALTDDVVAFMAFQLRKLPQSTQQVLQLAACIGNQFDLATLAIISEKSSIETAAYLWKALQEGLILPLSDVYKFYQQESLVISHLSLEKNEQMTNDQGQMTVTYKFLHDRVQQAAYSLIPDDQKQTTHYQIGQLLLQQISSEARVDRIFEIVNQLNYGTSLITQQTERDELAGLNLIACRKAKSATAYQAGREYASTGLSLLGENTWQQQYEMTLSFHNDVAELAMLCGDFEAMQQGIDIIIEQAHSLLEKVNIYRLSIQANTSQNKLIEAIAIGKQILQELGVNFPESPTITDIQQAIQEINELIANKDIEDFVHLPVMTDQNKIAIIQIASSLIAVTFIAGSPLFPFMILMSVKLSLQHGNTSGSALSYAAYGMILSSLLKDIDQATQFGHLALNVVSHLDDKANKPAVLDVIAGYILHRKSPTKDAIALSQEGYVIGLEIGNLEYAGFNISKFCINSFWSGQSLVAFEQDTRDYCHQLFKLKQLTAKNYCQIYWQATFNLLDVGEEPRSLLAESYLHETELLHQLLSTNDAGGLYLFYLHKLTFCFWFGEISSANNYAVETRRYLQASPGTVCDPVFYLYDFLVALAQLNANSDEQLISDTLERVAENQTQLEHWAYYAPMNHQHKVDLVAAEKCRVLGQKAEAIEFYDRAITLAKANEYIHEESLANELAAKFYLEWGKEKVAVGYMQEAYYCYARWGAKAKVVDLETRYPQLLQSILQQSKTSFDPLETLINITHSSIQASRTSSSISYALDFTSVLKAAQLLSSTIELDELLQQLTQIILHNSGGAKCILVLPDHETWHVRAISTPDTTELCSVPLDDHPDVPIKLIQYVKRTQSVVVIDNLQTDLPVIDDYLIQRQPKSVLCLPILNQGHLAGILYLKNQSTAGVFTSDRLTIINFLCTQAAISLENARLYEESQTYAQQLERSLAKLQVSETRFQNLANNIPGVVYQFRLGTDGSTSTPYISAGCLDLYELDPESVMAGNHSVYALHHPEDHPAIAQAIAYSAQNLTQFAQEWRIILPSGTIKWIQSAARPERQADGAILWDGVVIDISERKLAEQQLQASQQFLQLLINNIPQLVFWKDRNSTFLGCNITAAKTINLESPEQIVGKNDYDISIPEEAEWYRLCDRRVMESGEAELHIIETQQQADGTQHWLDTNKIPLRDSENNVIGILATIEDITERKQAEATLQEKEQFLRSIYDGAEIAIFVLDVLSDGSFRYAGWNPAAEKATGIRSVDVAGKTPTEVMGEEEGQRLEQRFAEIVTTGIDVSFEDHLSLHGQETWWFANLNPIKNVEGRVYRIIATTFDISDRKQAEFQLQRQAQADQLLASIAQSINQSVRLDRVLENCLEQVRQFYQSDRVLICRFDADYDVVIELEVLSQPELSLLGQTIVDPCFDQTWAERYRQGYITACNDAQAVDITPCYGELLAQMQVQASLAVGILGNDQIWGMMIVHHCHTTHVWQQSEIDLFKQLGLQIGIAHQKANLYTQLEAELAERRLAELALQEALTDLQNTQLQMVQSEKMSALGNLVAGVAHEMNNPLGFISASLEQAKPTFTDIIEHLKLYQELFPKNSEEIIDHAESIDLDYSLEDLPKMLDSMSMACDRLKNISTSLRTFSRADQDYKVPFNIHEGIDSTILILKHRLKANEQRPAIEVVTNYGNLPQIECFPGQLNQVFMNLIANAIDALDESNYGRNFDEIKTNPNGITITTSVENNLVKITIADNAKGINEEIKQKIFDHLFTTKAVGKGTGLGLAIARQIVEETHGGKLSFNSVLGEGTEFIIEIPG